MVRRASYRSAIQNQVSIHLRCQLIRNLCPWTHSVGLVVPYGRHRACAAFLAISFLRSGSSDAALAAPPFLPPSRPKWTAAASFFVLVSSILSESSPVAILTAKTAAAAGSSGRRSPLGPRAIVVLLTDGSILLQSENRRTPDVWAVKQALISNCVTTVSTCGGE